MTISQNSQNLENYFEKIKLQKKLLYAPPLASKGGQRSSEINSLKPPQDINQDSLNSTTHSYQHLPRSLTRQKKLIDFYHRI